MTPLPKNDDGIYIPGDSADISDDCVVVRGIPSECVVKDNQTNQDRPSSAAFRKSSEPKGMSGMSVDIAELIKRDGIDLHKHFQSNNKFPHWVTISVHGVRALTLQVGYTPNPDNKYHGDIFDDTDSELSRRLRKDIAKISNWL